MRIMCKKLPGFFLLLTLLTATSTVGQDLRIAAKDHRKLATLANFAVKSESLIISSDLTTIDQVLATEFGGDYAAYCGRILDGPKLSVVTDPTAFRGRLIIGFTDKAVIDNQEEKEGEKSQVGRYVYYWEQSGLRSSLFTEKNFQELVLAHKIDIARAYDFSFPELSALVAIKKPLSVPSSVAAPSSEHLPEQLPSKTDDSAEVGHVPSMDRDEEPNIESKGLEEESAEEDESRLIRWWALGLLFIFSSYLMVQIIRPKKAG